MQDRTLGNGMLSCKAHRSYSAATVRLRCAILAPLSHRAVGLAQRWVSEAHRSIPKQAKASRKPADSPHACAVWCRQSPSFNSSAPYHPPGLAWHLLPVQVLLAQSAAWVQALPFWHLEQVAPPQSTSVSTPFLMRSVQVGYREDMAPRGKGEPWIQRQKCRHASGQGQRMAWYGC